MINIGLLSQPRACSVVKSVCRMPRPCNASNNSRYVRKSLTFSLAARKEEKKKSDINTTFKDKSMSRILKLAALYLVLGPKQIVWRMKFIYYTISYTTSDSFHLLQSIWPSFKSTSLTKQWWILTYKDVLLIKYA